MGRKLLLVGAALAALWLVLTVTRVVVGGVLWLVLVAAVVALVIGGLQAIRSASRRGLGGDTDLHTRRRTHV